MRWRGNRQSSNLEDKRGMAGPTVGGMGGAGIIIRLLPLIFRLLGWKGTVVAVIGFVGYGIYSGDLSQILGGGQFISSNQSTQKPIKQSVKEKEMVNFVSVVLADTEDTWEAIFNKAGKTYKQPRLVLFRGAVKSGCGYGSAQMGPLSRSFPIKRSTSI